MGYIVASFLLLFGCARFIQKKTLAAPDVFFSFEWAIITLLAAMRLFTLYETGLKTWFIILVGTICFFLGTSLGEKLRVPPKRRNRDFVQQSHNPLMSKKVFWILLIILIAYTAVELRKTVVYIGLGYTLGEIRDASVGMTSIEGYVRNTSPIYEYLSLFCSVTELFVVAAGIEYFISDMKQNYKIILGVLVLVILKSLTTGGRFGLAYLAIETVVCYWLYKRYKGHTGIKLSKKARKIVRWMVIVVVAVIIYVSIIRGAQVIELIEKFYRYICGNIVFFDLHVKELDNSSFVSVTFAGLYGLWATILPILNMLGISYPETYIQTITQVMDGQSFRQIGDNLYTNAFITPFYHLYADLRLPGVIIGMFVFGAIAGRFYKRARQYMDGTHIAMYLITIQMIFKSLHIYPFAAKIYFCAFVVMCVLVQRKRRKA